MHLLSCELGSSIRSLYHQYIRCERLIFEQQLETVKPEETRKSIVSQQQQRHHITFGQRHHLSCTIFVWTGDTDEFRYGNNGGMDTTEYSKGNCFRKTSTVGAKSSQRGVCTTWNSYSSHNRNRQWVCVCSSYDKIWYNLMMEAVLWIHLFCMFFLWNVILSCRYRTIPNVVLVNCVMKTWSTRHCWSDTGDEISFYSFRGKGTQCKAWSPSP